jgi:hypothetical protein
MRSQINEPSHNFITKTKIGMSKSKITPYKIAVSRKAADISFD